MEFGLFQEVSKEEMLMMTRWHQQIAMYSVGYNICMNIELYDWREEGRNRRLTVDP